MNLAPIVRYHAYAWQTASMYILIAGFLVVIGLMVVYGAHPAGIAGMVSTFAAFIARQATFFPKPDDPPDPFPPAA